MMLDLIRHGATAANLAGRYNGASDDPLTTEQRLALQGVLFDHTCYDAVYCSPLRRATETAEALEIARWISESRIAERNFGIFERLTADECQEWYPKEFSAFLTFDADFRIPDGESRAQHLARIVAWIEDVKSSGRVLAITHGGTVDFLYRLGCGVSVHEGEKIHGSANASLSKFEVNWPNVRLIEYSIPLAN